MPISSTLKRVNEEGLVDTTVDREGLFAAQTPQAYRREVLVEAFRQRGDLVATDESQLVEQLGQPIRLIPGWPMNIKITTNADFDMAKALLNALPKDDLPNRLHPFSEIDPRDL